MVYLTEFIAIFLTIFFLWLLIPILGRYIARVFTDKPTKLDIIFYPIEEWMYKLIGTNPSEQMDWKEYAIAMLFTNLFFGLFAFVILSYQSSLPMNYFSSSNMGWSLAMHTTISYLTNTNFQHFNPVTQISMFSELFAIMLLLFVSPATGMSVGIAFIRGMKNVNGKIGNFYVDFIRSITRILLPMSFLFALLLSILGVPDTFTPFLLLHTINGNTALLPLGVNSSHTAIELLGTNGGGYINGGNSNPLSDPSGTTIFIETLMMLLLPFSVIDAFGQMIKKRNESRILLLVVFILFLFGTLSVTLIEMQGNPFLLSIPHLVANNGNYFGKDTRFGIPYSSFAQAVSVYTNTGATFTNIDMLLPGSQIVLLFGMFIQSIPGGVGVGFSTLLLYTILAVFLGALMVGKSPEYLGKKIEIKDVKYTSLGLIIHPIIIIVPFVITLLLNPYNAVSYSPHNLTEILYEFTSEAANNGSSMYVNDNNLFFNIAGLLVMIVGRYMPIVVFLAVAGNMSRKKVKKSEEGALKTSSITFGIYLIGVILILGALLFLPVIAVGPLREFMELLKYA